MHSLQIVFERSFKEYQKIFIQMKVIILLSTVYARSAETRGYSLFEIILSVSVTQSLLHKVALK